MESDGASRSWPATVAAVAVPTLLSMVGTYLVLATEFAPNARTGTIALAGAASAILVGGPVWLAFVGVAGLVRFRTGIAARLGGGGGPITAATQVVVGTVVGGVLVVGVAWATGVLTVVLRWYRDHGIAEVTNEPFGVLFVGTIAGYSTVAVAGPGLLAVFCVTGALCVALVAHDGRRG